MHAHDRRARSTGRSTLRVTLACGALGIAATLALVLVLNDKAHVGALKPLTPVSTLPGTTDSTPTRVAVDTTHGGTPAGTGHAPRAPGADEIRRVEGRVHGRGDIPIEGARVGVELAANGETRTLGSATSGQDGEYVLELPQLPAWPAGGELRVQADANHYRPGRRLMPIAHGDEQRAVRVDVRLESGERLSGRIVDTASKPVGGATVVLSVASVQHGAPTFVVVEELHTGADGLFDTGFASSARYHVAARADGIGSAFVEDLDLEAGVARHLGDLVLKGGPAISGTLTHEGGEPAAEFEVWAIDGNFANDPNGLALAVLKAPETERGDGLAYTKTFSDATGHFALRGLRPGQYALRSPDVHAILEPHQLRFEPGTSKLEMKVQSSRLLVHVVDEHGVPVRGASVRLTELSTQADGSFQPGAMRTQSVHGPDAIAAFTLDPEAPVAIEASTATRTSGEEVTLLAQNEFTRDVVLVLSSERGDGRLILDVQGADGHALANLRVAVLSSVTKARNEELGELETDAEGRLPPIPAGTYQLLVGFVPGTDRDHFPVRTSEPVVIRAGETTTLALCAKRGSRLSVRLSVRGSMPSGFDTPLPANATEVEKQAAEKARRAHFGTNVSIVPSAGGPQRALHFRKATGVGIVTEILPAETLITEDLFEPGAYDLSIESLTFVGTAANTVRLDAGQPGDVTIPVRLR